MARPAKELTDRELEVLHAFWRRGELTAAEARDDLAAAGTDRAYTTVATLVRILADKGYLAATNDERPFRYQASRSHEDVSKRLLEGLIDRVFGGSREQLLMRLLDRRGPSARERALLEAILGRSRGEGESP